MQAAIIPIIKGVGIVLSVKAMASGLKEGNYFKAILGAVGAYYGITSFGSTAGVAGGSSTVSDTAAGAAGDIAGDVAGEVAGGAANTGFTGAGSLAYGETAASAATPSVANSVMPEVVGGSGPAFGADGGTSFMGKVAGKSEGIIDSFKNMTDDAVANEIGANYVNPSSVSTGTGTGIIESLKSGYNSYGKPVMDFMKDNPAVVQTGLTLAGGYMQGKAQDKLLDYERMMSNRRGAAADVSGATRIRFDPNSKQFVRS